MLCAASENEVCAANFAICTHLVCGVCAKVCAWCVGYFEPYLGCAHLVCAVRIILKYVSVEVSSLPSGSLFTLLALFHTF
jgi:hypothetical protein